jgi:hypothetical protein
MNPTIVSGKFNPVVTNLTAGYIPQGILGFFIPDYFHPFRVK